jgi:hypothetical protein
LLEKAQRTLIPGGCVWKHTSQINHTYSQDQESNYNTVEDVWKDTCWHGICSGKQKPQMENMIEPGVYIGQQYMPDSIIDINRKLHTRQSWKYNTKEAFRI